MLRLKVCVLHNITELLLFVHRTATIRSPNRYYPFTEPLPSVRRTATGAKVHRHRGPSFLLMWNMSFFVMFKVEERVGEDTKLSINFCRFQTKLLYLHVLFLYIPLWKIEFMFKYKSAITFVYE
jgi:hypothetical protein